MDTALLNQLINTFGQDVIQEMKSELQSNGSIATSQLINSLNYKYATSLEKVLVQFLSEDYGKYIETGRKPGAYPPLSKIKQWCAVKGIPKRAALPIARKIYRFGIKPKPFLLKSVDKKKQDFVVGLLEVYEQEIIAEIKAEFLNKK